MISYSARFRSRRSKSVKIPFSCTVPGHCSAASGPPLARRVPRYCILRRAARLSVCSMPYVNTPRKARLESNRPAQTACDGLHDKRRSEEHTSELQSRLHLVCRLLLEKKKNNT